MTLTTAITRSINVIPVKLSIAMGGREGPRSGRAKIVDTARKMGVTAPLIDTPSLPIGSTEINVVEHTVAYATFPNRGRAVIPHAALEVRSSTGDLVWRFDRDGKKPVQAIPPQVATDMNEMMSHVVYEGTARRAIIDGVPAAGKTGTTNAFRDAWFVGFTGNFTAGVWFGNDDYSSTNRMTGGSLPAMTWRAIMVAAHQGVEIKDIPGVTLGKRAPTAATAANAALPGVNEGTAGPPPVLTKRGADILVRVEKLLDEAAKAVADPPPLKATTTSVPPVESFAAATQGDAAASKARKN
jgi:penicillin-binding protein 1A